jgi:hypothetical protein
MVKKETIKKQVKSRHGKTPINVPGQWRPTMIKIDWDVYPRFKAEASRRNKTVYDLTRYAMSKVLDESKQEDVAGNVY